MSDTNKQYIVYQGFAEQWRWRQIDADGNTVRDDEGKPVHSEIFFHDAESAKNDLLRHDPDASFDTQREADFNETVDDAEEREDLESVNG